MSPAHADLSIEGRAERVGTGLRAVLVLRDGSGAQLGVRELESDATDCTELRENAALAIALMIDPDAVLRPPPAPSTPATVTPPAPEVVIERVEVPAPETEQEREVIAIEALMKLGRSDEARLRADRFSRTFPGSAHTPRVMQLVDSAHDSQ